jgi:hypothetical protein
MDDQRHFLQFFHIWIITLLIFVISAGKCNAEKARLYCVEKLKTGTDTILSVEIIADVGNKPLGSYDLSIFYHQKALQFMSSTNGTTPGQPYPYPFCTVEDDILTVIGVYQTKQTGKVSFVILNFKCNTERFKTPFNIYIYSLFNNDEEMDIEIVGYQLTQYSYKRLTSNQHDGLPLIDLETANLISPLIGNYFDQESVFLNQIIELIGQEKTDKYRSNIVNHSRMAYKTVFSVNCPTLFDIVKCLQFFSGMTSSTCSDMTGDDHIGMNDIIRGFKQIALIPE